LAANIFCKALATIFGFAENIGCQTDSVDLSKLMEDDDLKHSDYTYENLTAIYILSKLAASQSMGLLESRFKNMK
jgi:hypothetical protein